MAIADALIQICVSSAVMLGSDVVRVGFPLRVTEAWGSHHLPTVCPPPQDRYAG